MPGYISSQNSLGMKMSIEEYNNYLQQLRTPASKEVVVKKTVEAKAKPAKKTLKRKTYRNSR